MYMYMYMYIYMGIVSLRVFCRPCVYTYICVHMYLYAACSRWLETPCSPPFVRRFHAMDLDSFRRGIKDEFFESSSAFQAHIQHKALDTGTLVDSPALRALCVFMHYKLVRTHRCSACKSRCILIQSRSGDELKWICEKNRNQTHFKKAVTVPAVSFLRPKSWIPFIHFLVYMKNNYKMAIVEKELHAGHGITKPCLYRWQKQYHSAIKKYVDEEKINRVGGPMHVCAVDESHVGKLGYMVGKKATSGGQSKRKKPRIKKRMPCQTKWHCGARHGKKKKHGTSKDTRKHSRWMWFGVDCGVKQVKTHGKGTKRVAASVLDHPETALQKKPRGAASISKVLSEHVKPGSKIASDGWISTTKAAKDSGLKMLGTCDHGTNFFCLF